MITYKPNSNFIEELEKSYTEYKIIKRNLESDENTKWLKISFVECEGDGKTMKLEVAERQTKIDDPNLPDAVSVLPYYVDSKGEVYFIVSSQFRGNVRSREISLFAGLLDKEDRMENETKRTILKAVSRELNEECGDVEVIKSMPITPIMNKSAGFSNETEQTFLVEIKDTIGKQHLEKTEDIKAFRIRAKDVGDFLDEMQESLENSSKTSTSIVIYNALNSVLGGRGKISKFIQDSVDKVKDGGIIK